MANLLPILLLGGGALMLAGGKKKKRRAVSKGNVYYTDDDRDLVEFAKKHMGARGVGIGVPNTPKSAAIIRAFKAASSQHKDLVFVISRGNLVPPSVKKGGHAAILVAGGVGGDGIIDYDDSALIGSADELRAQLGRFIGIARSKMPKVASPGASGAGAGRAKVKERQGMLDKTGFDPGKIDGRWGPNTKRALMAFQRATGITVDGKWGPQTAAAMAQALAMVAQGLGKAAFSQIGKMLGKFKETFEKLFSRERESLGDFQEPGPDAARIPYMGYTIVVYRNTSPKAAGGTGWRSRLYKSGQLIDRDWWIAMTKEQAIEGRKDGVHQELSIGPYQEQRVDPIAKG